MRSRGDGAAAAAWQEGGAHPLLAGYMDMVRLFCALCKDHHALDSCNDARDDSEGDHHWADWTSVYRRVSRCHTQTQCPLRPLRVSAADSCHITPTICSELMQTRCDHRRDAASATDAVMTSHYRLSMTGPWSVRDWTMVCP